MAKFEFEIDDQMSTVYSGSGGNSCLQVPSGLRFFKAPKAGGFRIEVIAFKVGKAVENFDPELRFSPPDKWHWNCIFYQHGGIGMNNDKVVCPYCTFGRKGCPICEKRAELGRDPHPDARKAAKDLKPKKRQILLVALRDERSGALGPVELWDVATFNFLDQLQMFIDASDADDYEARNRFWHPTKGLTLKVYGTEESAGEGGHKYTKYAVVEMKARREPIPVEVFQEAPDLFGMVKQKKYDAIRQLFLGAEPDEGDADDADASPPSRNGRYQSVAGDSTSASKTRPDSDGDELDKKGATTFKLKDRVAVTVGGKRVAGVIIGIEEDRQTAQVRVPNKENPATFDWEELELITESAEPDEDETPPPAAKKKAPPAAPPAAPPPVPDPEDESGDEGPEAPAPKKRPAAAPAKGGWDDDDEALPPPPKKGKR